MSAITVQRRQLRIQATERQRTTLKKLKAKLKLSRDRKKKKLKVIRNKCKREQARIRRQGDQDVIELRAHIRRAKGKAQAACKVLRVSATAAELDTIDKALGAVQVEREAIQQLRRRAGGLKDPRGVAGGRRSQELRRESDDRVRNNLSDPWHRVVWEQVKHKIKAGRHSSRTEAFLQYIHDHPGSVWEAQAEAESRWIKEAEAEERRMVKDWQASRPLAKLSDTALSKLDERTHRTEQLMEQVPF